MTVNPFINLGKKNPFLDEPEPEMVAVMVPVKDLPECGDPACKRKHRPGSGGEHYSTDSRERVAQLNEEGRMGPAFAHLGGRPPAAKTRATKIVADMAKDEAEAIAQVFRDGIDAGNPIQVRLLAAEKLLKVEEGETEREQRNAEREWDKMSKQDLSNSIMQMVAKLTSASAIVDEVVNGSVHEPEQISDAEVV